MKINLIVDRCQLEEQDALIPQVARLLRAWGIVVKPIIPEAGYFNLAHIQPTSDLYLLTACSPLALTLAGMLQTMSAALVNPYSVADALHNKLIGLHTLQAQGLPIPETYAISNLAQAKELLAIGPLLIYPQSTVESAAELQSERLVSHVRELQTALTPHNPLVAQRGFAPCARHWMIYCIGGHLWSIGHTQLGHRRFRKSLALPPAKEYWDYPFPPGYRAAVAVDDAATSSTAELRELALRCGRVFDIDLFGINVVEHQGVLYVVDMVNFPDFRQVPEAAPRLAEYLYARAQFVSEEKCAARAVKTPKPNLLGSLALPSKLAYPIYTSVYA